MKPHTKPMIQTISSTQRHPFSLRRCLAIPLFLTIIAFLQPVQAQPKYGISAITTVTPPYPITLDGFVAEGGTKMALQILPTDVTIAQYPVLLKLVISGNGITLESRTLTIHEPVYLNGNEITRLDGNDLQAFFNPDNLNFNGYSKTQYQRNGRLPEGVYTVGFELYDVLRKIQVASVKSTLVFLFLNEVPSLNLPLSGDLISAAGTQVVNFRWSTRHSPLAATFFTPQYLFELWDIQPEGMNPYEIVRGTRPVYATTVSSTYLSYGIAEPPLLPGHTYAWRVRESDPDGKTLFKNDGYTEVYTFKYGINCPAPELKADKAGTSNLSVWWQANPDENKFELHYRDKKKKNPEWYTQSVNTLSSKVENLKSNTVYEIEVCAICGDQRSEYSNRVEMNTRQNTSFKCGQIDSSKLPQNQNPLRKLSSGDVFKAFGFDVEVKEASGSGGTFTGKGYVLVPLLNFIKIEAKFDNARINEDYQLIGGEVKTVYNLKNSLTYIPGQGVAGLSDLTDLAKLIAGDKEKNQFDDLAYKKIEVDSVKEIKIDGNKIIVTDANGKTEEVPLTAGKVVSIKTDEGKEYVVDGNGTIYSSGNSGQKTTAGNPSGPATTAALAGKGSPKYNVSFIPHALQECGFDYPTDKSPKDNYEQVSLTESPILVPWKSLEAGHIERTVAEITGGPADSVRYYRQSNNVVMTAPGEKATQKQIMLNGNGKNDEDKLFAWYAAYNQSDSGKTYARVLAGQLNLISYEKKAIKVVMVPVNNASCPNPDYVKTELNKIYKSAVVEWDVALGNNLKVTFPSGTVFDNTDPNDRMDYTDDMKAVISALKEDAQYNGETYYLFFLDNAKDRDTKGYMPLKQQFGFIFKYQQYPDEYLRTIAHELGHGPFRLWHTFSNSNKYIQPQGTTDNLMDYANASALKLNKYQWDWMHDPEWRLYWFTEEDEAKEENTDIILLISEKAKQLSEQLKTNVYAVIHVTNCNDVPKDKPIKDKTITNFASYNNERPKPILCNLHYDKDFQQWFIAYFTITGENKFSVSSSNSAVNNFSGQIKQIPFLGYSVPPYNRIVECEEALSNLDEQVCSQKFWLMYDNQQDKVNSYIELLLSSIIKCLEEQKNDKVGDQFYREFGGKTGSDAEKQQLRQISDAYNKIGDALLKNNNTEGWADAGDYFRSLYEAYKQSGIPFDDFLTKINSYLSLYEQKKAELEKFTDSERIALAVNAFTDKEIECLSLDLRTKCLTLLASERMTGSFNLFGHNEEYTAIRLIKYIKDKDIKDFLSKLQVASDDKALIVSLINRIDDGIFGIGGDNFQKLMIEIRQLITKSSDFSVRLNQLFSKDNFDKRLMNWQVSELSLGAIQVKSVDLENSGILNVQREQLKDLVCQGYVYAKTGICNEKKEYWEDAGGPVPLNPFDLIIFANNSNLDVINEATESGKGEFVIVPALYLKYATQKEFNSDAAQAVAITADVITIASSGGALAVAENISRLRRAWLLFQTINSTVNLTINISGIANDPDFKGIVEAYNIINCLIAVGDLSYNGAKNLPSMISRVEKATDAAADLLKSRAQNFVDLLNRIDRSQLTTEAAKASFDQLLAYAGRLVSRFGLIVNRNVYKLFEIATFRNLPGQTPGGIKWLVNFIFEDFTDAAKGLKIEKTSLETLDGVADELARMAREGDLTGAITEGIAEKIMTRKGYTILKDGTEGMGKYGSNNGYDIVAIKGTIENPTEIVIIEGKQFKQGKLAEFDEIAGTNYDEASGLKINKANAATGLPTQMSNNWISYVAARLRDAGKTGIADMIDDNPNLIGKYIFAIDKSLGDGYFLKLSNAF